VDPAPAPAPARPPALCLLRALVDGGGAVARADAVRVMSNANLRAVDAGATDAVPGAANVARRVDRSAVAVAVAAVAPPPPNGVAAPIVALRAADASPPRGDVRRVAVPGGSFSRSSDGVADLGATPAVRPLFVVVAVAVAATATATLDRRVAGVASADLRRFMSTSRARFDLPRDLRRARSRRCARRRGEIFVFSPAAAARVARSLPRRLR